MPIRIKDISLFALVRAVFGLFGLFYFQTSSFVHFFKPPALFQIPLFDINPLQSPAFLMFIQLLFIASIVFFILGKRVEISGLIAGITKFIFLISYLNGVLAFSYLIPLGFMAFAFIALMEKENEKTENLELPISLLIASLYIVAALEKLVHFEGMKLRLTLDLVNYYRPSFLYYCPYGSCWVMDIATWTVIPVELIIGCLFLFYRFRRLALIINSFFILILFSFVSFRTVGVLLITLQLALAFIRSGWKISDINIKSFRSLFYLLPLFILHLFIKSSELPIINFINEVVINIMIFLPFIILSDYAIKFKKEKSVNSYSYRTLLWPAIYSLILLSYALIPVIEGHRKTHQMGWSMFSGATATNSHFKFQLKRNGCPPPPNYSPLVNKFNANQIEIYSSFSEDLITRYRNKIIELCPDANVSDLSESRMSN